MKHGLNYAKLLIAFLFFLLGTLENTWGVSPPRSGDQPWFTGPLITPSSRVVKRGHVLLEPYMYYNVTTGFYDKHWHAESVPKFYQINPLLVAKVGLTERSDFSTVIQSVYNWSQGATGSGFGDLTAGFEYQLLSADETNFPIKISIHEIFPTGRFDNLKLNKHGTDISGMGSYTTLIAFTVGNLHHFCGDHYLQTRLNWAYGIPAPLHVKGLNVYGGDPTTRGKVFPGHFSILSFGAEYSMTKNWVLAMDLVGQIYDRDNFKGHTIVKTGLPVFVQFLAAPAIEYNFNENVGIIAGSIFTFAGKNAARFISAAAALNWFF